MDEIEQTAEAQLEELAGFINEHIVRRPGHVKPDGVLRWLAEYLLIGRRIDDERIEEIEELKKEVAELEELVPPDKRPEKKIVIETKKLKEG